MAFKMMNADRRPIERSGDGARDSGADEKRARQPRAPRVGNDIDIVKRTQRLTEHVLEQRQHAPDVIPGRQLGDDTSVGGVQRDLAVERLPGEQRQTRSLRANESDPGLVARGLDANDIHQPSLGRCVR